MAVPAPTGDRAARDHGFHAVRVARVVTETDDARSFVLDVPAALRDGFGYRAGQFCTFRVRVGDATLLRCYSMSSAPEVDPELTVTVKRVPGGAVSNWLIDHLGPGDEVEITYPAGVFLPEATSGDVVGFAAGSGITPIMSIMRSTLATAGRDVRLLYANRDRASTIFAAELDRMERDAGGRLHVEHRSDVEHGYVDGAAVRAFMHGAGDDAEVFVCGPTPFMDVVEATLVDLGVEPGRIHIERFTPADDLTDDGADDLTHDGADDGRTVVIEVDGRSGETVHREGTTLLQTARQLGLDPPSSCESGSCATCMGRLVEGTVTMRVNDALSDDEVAEGWVLTCQSVPTSPRVHVIYGYD